MARHFAQSVKVLGFYFIGIFGVADAHHGQWLKIFIKAMCNCRLNF